MGGYWKQLADAGLIGQRKLKNLQTNPDTISKFAMHGFIRRQLVETSQVIKLVANILGDKYRNDDTKIIEITARMNHQMRDEFGFIKNREINDYHHAFDAYLTAFWVTISIIVTLNCGLTLSMVTLKSSVKTRLRCVTLTSCMI